jgi:hypothetical protein
MAPRIVDSDISQKCKIIGQYLSSNAKRFHEHVRKINGDFARDHRLDHPHGMAFFS